MSTLESGSWVTLIQQLDGVVTRENDKQVDDLVYLKRALKKNVNTVEVDLHMYRVSLKFCLFVCLRKRDKVWRRCLVCTAFVYIPFRVQKGIQ